MISRKAINGINAAAVLLLAVYIGIVALHLFQRDDSWVGFGIIAVAVLLTVVSAFARLRMQKERKRVIKSTRASLLKRKWELRHRREW
jgi:membrane protein YdbS with pleckstrin-like domain